MKRSWFGLFLLLFLLGLCILVTVAMTRIHEPLEAELNRAADFALEENWLRAGLAFREAQAQWTRWEHFRACFADHEPVEEIGAAFAQLEVYRQEREAVAFAGGCRELAQKTTAVGEAHALVWWNLL